MNISVVLGTRPEVIKLAPVIHAADRAGHRVKVILTGQHRHMALPLMKFFKITPALDLDVMTENQTLSSLTSKVLDRLSETKALVGSDCVIVQGDTTSAFAAAYWGFCNRVKVVHVEAGLRTYDLASPFPEEANRQLIGRIADFHFAPTLQSANALVEENVPAEKVFKVGNTAIDALMYTMERLDSGQVEAHERLPSQITDFTAGGKVVLVTAHRRESFGPGFEGMCNGIRAVADSDENVRLVYPVHPNPNVRRPVEKFLSGHPRILLCDPLPYVAFVELMRTASVILTDSGGVQEEGPSLRKPILVMRKTTERPEGVEAGFAKLVGTDANKILSETLFALAHGSQAMGENPYGDGKAAQKIVQVLENHLIEQRMEPLMRRPAQTAAFSTTAASVSAAASI